MLYKPAYRLPAYRLPTGGGVQVVQDIPGGHSQEQQRDRQAPIDDSVYVLKVLG